MKEDNFKQLQDTILKSLNNNQITDDDETKQLLADYITGQGINTTDATELLRLISIVATTTILGCPIDVKVGDEVFTNLNPDDLSIRPAKALTGPANWLELGVILGAADRIAHAYAGTIDKVQVCFENGIRVVSMLKEIIENHAEPNSVDFTNRDEVIATLQEIANNA